MRLNLTEAERLRLRNEAARRRVERLERRLQQQAVPTMQTDVGNVPLHSVQCKPCLLATLLSVRLL